MAEVATSELQVLISAQSNQFNAEMSKVQGQLSSLGGKVGSVGSKAMAIGSLVASAISKAFSSIGNSIDGAVSRLDTLNNFPRVMSNLNIGVEDSQKSIQILSDKLMGLPTALDDAALGVQRLTSSNKNIAASTSMFLALNNAILAGGAATELQSTAIEQMTQAYAKGKADAVEWRAMLTAMPGQMNQIAQAMGYVSADVGGDLYEAMQKGKVSMNDFMNTIVQLNNKGLNGFQSFADQARNATGGVATSVANMKTAITRGIANIMNEIGQSNIAAFFNGISKAIGTVSNYVAAFIRVIKEAIAWVSVLFGGKGSGSTAGMVKETATASSNVGGIASGASDAAKNLGGANKQAKKLKGTLASFDEMNVLADKSAGDSGSGGSGGSGGGGGGGSTAVPDFNWDDNILNNTADKVQEIADKIKKWFKDAFGDIDFEPLIDSLFNFGREGERVFKALIKIGQSFIKDCLKPIAKWTVEKGLPQFFNDTASAFKKLDLDRIVKGFESLFKGISKFTIGIGQGLLTFYREAVLPLAVFAANNILPPFLEAVGAALSIIGDVASKASSMLSPLIGIFGQIILVPIAVMLQAVAGALTAIASNELAITILASLASAITTVVVAYQAYQFIMGVVNGLELIRQGAIIASTTGTAAYTAGVGLATAAQNLWTGAVALFHTALGPLGLAVMALTAVFAALSFTNQDNTNKTEALRAKMSEHEKQLDANRDGVVSYTEALKVHNDIMLSMTNAELSLMNAEEQQRQKSVELTNAVNDLNLNMDQVKNTVKNKSLTDEEAAKTLGINIDQYRNLREKVLEAQKADLTVVASQDKVKEANQKTADQIKIYTEQYDKAIKAMEAHNETGLGTEKTFNEQKKKAQELEQKIKELGGTIEGTKNWADISYKSGTSVGQGYINGLNSKKYPWQQANSNFASSGKNAFNNTAGIHSPSRLYAKLGRYVGMGAIKGISAMVKPFEQVNAEMAMAGADAFSKYTMADLPTINDNFASKFATKIDGQVQSVVEANSPHVTVNIGGDTLVDKVIDGINDASFMKNQAVIAI